ASSFKKGTERLTIAQERLSATLVQMPLELPEPLKEANLRQFPSSRKRAMTGREAAEEQERDQARQRRREEMKPDALAAAEDAIEAGQREIEEEATLVAEHWLESQNAIALDSDESKSDSFLSLD